MLKYCLHKNNLQEICQEAANVCLPLLKLVLLIGFIQSYLNILVMLHILMTV